MAILAVRALLAQTVVTRGGHQRQQRRTFIHALQLAHVPAAGAARKLLDAVHAGLQLPQVYHRILACQLQPVQAQITAAPLQQGLAQRQAQQAGEVRQVTREELVLQVLGSGRYQYALATEQRRDQIGKGLAHARAGLHHQRLAACDGIGHGTGHVQLAIALAIGWIVTCQRPIGRQHVGDLFGQLAMCGPRGICRRTAHHAYCMSNPQDRTGHTCR